MATLAWPRRRKTRALMAPRTKADESVVMLLTKNQYIATLDSSHAETRHATSQLGAKRTLSNAPERVRLLGDRDECPNLHVARAVEGQVQFVRTRIDLEGTQRPA